MKPVNAFLLLLLFAEISFAVTNQIRCFGGGSDGPKPLFDGAATLSPAVNSIQTVGNIADFLLWEKKAMLLYRTTSNAIIAQPVVGQEFQSLGQSALPLSRLVDPQENFLLLERSPWFFNALQDKWERYSHHATPDRHLFWNNGTLFSVASAKEPLGDKVLTIYQKRPGEHEAVAVCQLRHLHLAEGHQFPYVFAYTTSHWHGQSYLRLHFIDITRCAIVDNQEYQDPLPGRVLAVHRFEEQRATLVEVNHPAKSLLWTQRGGTCKYLDKGNRDILVLSHHSPLIAAWNQGSGLSLLNLKTQKAMHLELDVKAQKPSPRDFWLTQNLQEIYWAVRPGPKAGRKLIRITVPTSK